MYDISSLTQPLKCGLICLGTGDLISSSLSFSDLVVKSEHPAVTLSCRGFEVKFAGSKLQDKLVISTGNDIGNIGLNIY